MVSIFDVANLKVRKVRIIPDLLCGCELWMWLWPIYALDIHIDWMSWNMADPQTTKMKRPMSQGPTGYFDSFCCKRNRSFNIFNRTQIPESPTLVSYRLGRHVSPLSDVLSRLLIGHAHPLLGPGHFESRGVDVGKERNLRNFNEDHQVVLMTVRRSGRRRSYVLHRQLPPIDDSEIRWRTGCAAAVLLWGKSGTGHGDGTVGEMEKAVAGRIRPGNTGVARERHRG